ncbi:Chitinase 4 [Entomophthora muscae]|uniref:Chitinase 4 n=1 Tax=Entomophthora muscae TaxID=34485 RepID=A0ACC2U414_9FUNG|nr:Chitinase 4 [Entomophthora muscae]
MDTLPTNKRNLIGYFQTQMQTPIEGRINVTNISPRANHVIFAFALVNGEAAECMPQDAYYDTQDTSPLPLVKLGNNGNASCTTSSRGNGNLAALYAFKYENPHVRVLLSVGGASPERTANFTKATSGADRAANLARSCVRLAMDYGLDGIDYDWESPSSTEEWDNYAELLRQTRVVLDSYQYSNRYLMSVALMPMVLFENTTHKSIPKIASQVDFVNLMTYDAAPGSDRALHNAPLYSTSESYGAMSINDTITKALEYFSPNKIIVGQPLYGVLINTQPKNNTRGLFDPVYTPGSGAGAGIVANQGAVSRSIMYNSVRDTYLSNENFTRYWDDAAKATWLFNPTTHQFLTYSDESSIQAVLDYVEKMDLGGIFFWQMGGSFNRKTSREELVEFTASHMSVDYQKRAVCAPQASFCNIRSDCPSNMQRDGILLEKSQARLHQPYMPIIAILLALLILA